MDFLGKNFTGNPTAKQEIGKIGEDLACEWLKRQGFSISQRNYLKKCGEIDVVAKKGSKLYFIEVKTVTRGGNQQSSLDTYAPEDNIHPWKLKRLAKTIEVYLLEKGIDENADWQIDAICVYLTPSQKLLKIEYIEEIL